ncbi:endonuclease 4-like isoform X1 [Glycine soja]|uniref:Aspergillus nuclease S1 n=1 Tax=Glycine soja TaxID=3848 RepID=A0A0B2NSQ4_GLYSO|nr:endonuclease 4-like isoform X1 [Glycine soja]KHN00115.1 Nuclease PA3 [Glycine soja]RZB95484.1 Endonuclease 4 [Glycine soja]
MHMIIGYERVRVLFLLFLIPLPTVLGWGKEGHYATCKIAQEYLSEDALFAVKQLLPDSAQGDLAAVCSWADEVGHTHRYHWSSALHYVDTPDFKCNYEYCRDCHDSYRHKHRCVSGAIYNYTMQLKSADAGISSEFNYNLTEALMFLSHFVGDIHQPLHVGFTGDLGGNTITVHWYRRKANLHYVWDDLIIQSALKTFYDSDLSIMIQAIQRNITDNWLNDVSTWEHCAHNYTACPNRYASESISLACKFAYRNATPGSTLKDEYFLSRLPVVEKRLAQGGVRLAAILNRIFTSSKTRIAQA